MKKEKEQPEELSLGKKHSIMLTTSKNVYIWGQNKEFQLGFHSQPGLLDSSGAQNENLPVKLNIRKIKKIAAGDKHSLFIDQQGKLYFPFYQITEIILTKYSTNDQHTNPTK